MIKITIKLLTISLWLCNALLLECMEVQQNLDANQELINAVKSGNLEGVEAALSKGADVNHATNEDMTALSLAARDGHEGIVRVLLEHKADANRGYPLLFAMDKGRINIVKILIEAGADPNEADNFGHSALMEAAMLGYTQTVRLLLKAGADINHADHEGNTALIWAATRGYIDIVKMLIERGADINHTNDGGNDALILSLINMTRLPDSFYAQLLATARLLIEHGATIPTEGDLQRYAQRGILRFHNPEYAGQALSAVFEGNELAYAAARGDTKRVVVLLSTLPQAQPQSPQTKSLIAQLRKLLASYAILAPMIPPQININHPDSHGMTALHWAAAQGHDDIIKLLLDFGANINLRNVEGNTPLHLAARNGNLSTVRLLLARGANATLVNRDGQTPLGLARQYHRSAIVDLLGREAGRAVFGRVSRLGRTGQLAWQPVGQEQPLPSEIADIIAQFAQAPGHVSPAVSRS